MSRRIAIFQAEWPVQIHTANLARMLARAGYGVDLFVYNPGLSNYVDLAALGQDRAVAVHDLTPMPRPASPPALSPPAGRVAFLESLKRGCRSRLPRLTRVLTRMYSNSRQLIAPAEAWRLLRRSDAGLLPGSLVSAAGRVMAGRPYHCLIGVEKKGLIWAGQVGAAAGVPVVYYSLELFVDDVTRRHKRWSLEFRRLRAAERAHHRRAAATIIQDRDRARVLFRDNRLPLAGAAILYLPVSVMGPPRIEPSRFLRDAFGLGPETKIILSFGVITAGRCALDLAAAAQAFPDDQVLVMHGPVLEASCVDAIRAIDRRGKVLLSLDQVPAERVSDVIASADVGLSFYPPALANDRLTAFSSEKMALYTRCGVPFIAFDYPGYRRLANEARCGAVIREWSELPGAVQAVLASHDELRRNAWRAFERYYDYERNWTAVQEGFETLRPAAGVPAGLLARATAAATLAPGARVRRRRAARPRPQPVDHG